MDLMGFFLVGLAISYITQMLLYQDLESHFGPFKSNSKFVYNPDTRHSQPVTLFDWLRRLTVVFNPYSVDGNIWTLKPNIDRWECAFCLSFWIALPFVAYLTIRYQLSAFEAIVAVFALSMVSHILDTYF